MKASTLVSGMVPIGFATAAPFTAPTTATGLSCDVKMLIHCVRGCPAVDPSCQSRCYEHSNCEFEDATTTVVLRPSAALSQPEADDSGQKLPLWTGHLVVPTPVVERLAKPVCNAPAVIRCCREAFDRVGDEDVLNETRWDACFDKHHCANEKDPGAPPGDDPGLLSGQPDGELACNWRGLVRCITDPYRRPSHDECWRWHHCERPSHQPGPTTATGVLPRSTTGPLTTSGVSTTTASSYLPAAPADVDADKKKKTDKGMGKSRKCTLQAILNCMDDCESEKPAEQCEMLCRAEVCIDCPEMCKELARSGLLLSSSAADTGAPRI